MAELKLGNKYECFNCGARFYDLGKAEPVCPKCGSNQKEAENAEPPLVTQATRRKKSALPREVADDEEEVTPAIGIDDEDLDDEDLDVDEELSEELEGVEEEDDEP